MPQEKPNPDRMEVVGVCVVARYPNGEPRLDNTRARDERISVGGHVKDIPINRVAHF